MQPIVPQLPRTGNVLVDRALDAIWVTFRRLGIAVGKEIDDAIGKVKVDSTDTPYYAETKIVGSATATVTKSGAEGARVLTVAVAASALDDHLVKSSDTDATAVGGLVQKTKAGSNITLSEVTDSGVKKLQITASVPAADDHLVKASNADATAVGGLAEKSLSGNNILIDTLEDGGVLKLRVTATGSDILPTQNGVAYAGLGPGLSRVDHTHPEQSLPPVKALCGAQVALAVWTEGPTGTWTRDVEGTFSGSPWADYVTLVNGDTIFMTDWVQNTNVFYDVQAGLYEILEVGSGVLGDGVKAVIRRAASANEDAEFVPGMSVLISSGTTFGGKSLYLLNPPITVDVTEQRWGLSATGTSAHSHRWSDIEPVGTATMPMPSLTIASGGKLTLSDGNIFTVDPDGNDLTQISVPNCDAYQTVPVKLIFTLPVVIQNQVAADSGFAQVHVAASGSINAPLNLMADFSSVDLIFIAGEWLVTSTRSTE